MQRFGLLRKQVAAVEEKRLAKEAKHRDEASRAVVEATPRGEILDSALLRFRQRVETCISEDGFGVLIGARKAPSEAVAKDIAENGLTIGQICYSTDLMLRVECRAMAPISRSGGMRGHHREALKAIDRFLACEPPEKDNENDRSPLLLKWGQAVIDLLEAIEHCGEMDRERKPAVRRKGGANGQGVRKPLTAVLAPTAEA
jgi:hypothetical protein